jgi:DNA-binding transcriptional LysR family regulator
MSAIYAHVHRLWLFSLLAEYRSFKRAAAHSGLTQSALSQHLSTLEGALNRTLVIRSRGLLKLTDEGERLAVEIVPILQSLDALMPGTLHGGHAVTKLRLGAYESAAISYLPQPLHRLMSGPERVRVQLTMARSSVLHSLVREGELDVVVLDTPAGPPLESVPFARSRLGLYASARNSADIGKSAKAIKIGTLSYGRGGHPDYFQRFLDFHHEHFAARGIESSMVMESDSFELLRAMAEAGAIVAVLPEHVAERTKGDLVELRVDDRPDDCAGNHVLYLVSRHVNRGFLDALKPQLRSVVHPPPALQTLGEHLRHEG